MHGLVLLVLRFGVNFIEDGVLYDTVRLCRLEPSRPDECDAR